MVGYFLHDLDFANIWLDHLVFLVVFFTEHSTFCLTIVV